MEFEFNSLTFSQAVNTALYIVSGFFFGIFASRNSLFAIIRIRNIFAEKKISSFSLFNLLFSILFLVLAFLIFPSWLLSRTMAGSIAYYTVLLFYFSKGLKNNSFK